MESWNLTKQKLFQISYKQGNEQEQGEYNYQATLTPGYQSQRKLDPLKDVSLFKFNLNSNFILYSSLFKCFPLWLQKNYRQHIDQVKYSPVTDTPEIILAKKNAQLVSNVSTHHKHTWLIMITFINTSFISSTMYFMYEHWTDCSAWICNSCVP